MPAARALGSVHVPWALTYCLRSRVQAALQNSSTQLTQACNRTCSTGTPCLVPVGLRGCNQAKRNALVRLFQRQACGQTVCRTQAVPG